MDFYGISKEDLDMERTDYIATKLTVDDYDWILYELEIAFKLKGGVSLYLKEEFRGFVTDSYYTLRYTKGDDVTEVTFGTNSDVAEKHIKQNMQKHLDLWDKDAWFINQTDFIIDQYNEVCGLLRMAKEHVPKEKTYKRTDKSKELLCTE